MKDPLIQEKAQAFKMLSDNMGLVQSYIEKNNTSRDLDLSVERIIEYSRWLMLIPDRLNQKETEKLKQLLTSIDYLFEIIN
jgi:hypothetical protein